MSKVIDPEDEQKRLFEEASSVVSVQGFYMKRCLDSSKLMDALKHASNMICELRTGLLTPKNYYALYMSVFDQLRHLEQYLADNKHGRRMTELYELVQYAGNILPRLYLLITVGSVYIKSDEAPAKDVLRDLVEMCRGVQHPTRGLFLRTYLSEMTKDKLPDADPAGVATSTSGTVRDSVEFVLQNFTEMNKLWVRLQHHGPVSQRKQREAERRDLRLLIGKNLARLSQLDGVSVDLYTEVVLHRLLEQIVSCRDVIAQQYLMECVIQVFPDDFHLATLDTLLSTMPKLQPDVDVRTIVSSLIDRLAEFAARDDTGGEQRISGDSHVFDAFYACVQSLAAERPRMDPTDLFALHRSLAGLALRSYTSDTSYVDRCLTAAADYLDQLVAAERIAEARTPAATKELRQLLQLPLDAYDSLERTLELAAYARVARHLEFGERRQVALEYARAATAQRSRIGEPQQVVTLFSNVEPLLRDADDEPSDAEPLDDEDFAEEQNLAAALVHVLYNADPDAHFTLLGAARKAYGQGGARRIRFTLVPLVFAALSVARRVRAACGGDDQQWQTKGKKLLEFLHSTITALAKTDECTELALRLFLAASLEAGQLGFESVAYEFLARSFSLYEELAKAEAQFQAITMIIATVQRSTAFGSDNYDTLVAKSAQYAAKLLLKEAQCRAVYMVSHLFWKKGADGTFDGTNAVRDGKRVLECLQKSLKIADSCMESNVIVQLFVEILNRYLYYFERDNEAVSVKYLSGLIALINTNLANLDASGAGDSEAVQQHYANTLAYISAQKETSDAERFAAIKLE